MMMIQLNTSNSGNCKHVAEWFHLNYWSIDSHLPIPKMSFGVKIEVVCFVISLGNALLTVKGTMFNERFKLLCHK